MRKIVIVGAVAGGATVGSQIRRLDSESEIVIFEKDRDMSFANCGLPYYIGGVVQDRDQILEATPEAFYDKKKITVKPYHEVTAVNTETKTVTVYNRENNETFEESYDTLILSPGCRANRLDVDSDMIFTLRNMEDTDAIDQYIREHQVQRALVIGAGYISLEILENLYHRGIEPTLIHRSEEINKLMDQDMNSPIIDELEKRGISYRFNEEMTSVDGHTVTFKSGKQEDYDLIIEGVGVKPNSEFLKDSGLQLDDKGYLPVNTRFETTVPDVYALGDLITQRYRHVDLPAHVPLAWGAHRGASIIAEQLAGDSNVAFPGFLGANIVKFFDYTFASVGVKPQELEHFDYTVVETKQNQHAGYFPGNERLHLRVYFENDSRKIIRAAAVGKDGADKRIDVLSMAMQNQLTVDELTDFEVTYAPPYSSPKDAINMIGYKARNK